MATLSNNDIAEAIYFLSKDKDAKEQSEISKKVVSFLSKRRLLSKAPEILSRLSKIVNKEEGRVEAKITSAEKIDSKTNSNLQHFLKHRYSAKHVELHEKVDPEILGGIRIEVGDEVIDLSMKNRIRKLQAHLVKE